MTRFKPYRPEEEEPDLAVVPVILRFFGADPFFRFFGFVVLQYGFVWNWRRAIDPRERSVLYAGVAVWLVLMAFVLAVVVVDG